MFVAFPNLIPTMLTLGIVKDFSNNADTPRPAKSVMSDAGNDPISEVENPTLPLPNTVTNAPSASEVLRTDRPSFENLQGKNLEDQPNTITPTSVKSVRSDVGNDPISEENPTTIPPQVSLTNARPASQISGMDRSVSTNLQEANHENPPQERSVSRLSVVSKKSNTDDEGKSIHSSTVDKEESAKSSLMDQSTSVQFEEKKLFGQLIRSVSKLSSLNKKTISKENLENKAVQARIDDSERYPPVNTSTSINLNEMGLLGLKRSGSSKSLQTSVIEIPSRTISNLDESTSINFEDKIIIGHSDRKLNLSDVSLQTSAIEVPSRTISKLDESTSINFEDKILIGYSEKTLSRRSIIIPENEDRSIQTSLMNVPVTRQVSKTERATSIHSGDITTLENLQRRSYENSSTSIDPKIIIAERTKSATSQRELRRLATIIDESKDKTCQTSFIDIPVTLKVSNLDRSTSTHLEYGAPNVSKMDTSTSTHFEFGTSNDNLQRRSCENVSTSVDQKNLIEEGTQCVTPQQELRCCSKIFNQSINKTIQTSLIDIPVTVQVLKLDRSTSTHLEYGTSKEELLTERCKCFSTSVDPTNIMEEKTKNAMCQTYIPTVLTSCKASKVDQSTFMKWKDDMLSLSRKDEDSSPVLSKISCNISPKSLPAPAPQENVPPLPSQVSPPAPNSLINNYLKIDKPVLICPADKPAVLFIPGVANLPILTHHLPFPLQTSPQTSVPWGPYSMRHLPAIPHKTKMHPYPMSSFPLPFDMSAGIYQYLKGGLLNKHQKSKWKSSSRVRKEQGDYEADESSVTGSEEVVRKNKWWNVWNKSSDRSSQRLMKNQCPLNTSDSDESSFYTETYPLPNKCRKIQRRSAEHKTKVKTSGTMTSQTIICSRDVCECKNHRKRADTSECLCREDAKVCRCMDTNSQPPQFRDNGKVCRCMDANYQQPLYREAGHTLTCMNINGQPALRRDNAKLCGCMHANYQPHLCRESGHARRYMPIKIQPAVCRDNAKLCGCIDINNQPTPYRDNSHICRCLNTNNQPPLCHSNTYICRCFDPNPQPPLCPESTHLLRRSPNINYEPPTGINARCMNAAPQTTYCKNCQCGHCSVKMFRTESAKCDTATQNACDVNTCTETNITHVNATMFHSVQISLHNSNSKKNQKIKKFNFSLETLKILGSLLAGISGKSEQADVNCFNVGGASKNSNSDPKCCNKEVECVLKCCNRGSDCDTKCCNMRTDCDPKCCNKGTVCDTKCCKRGNDCDPKCCNTGTESDPKCCKRRTDCDPKRSNKKTECDSKCCNKDCEPTLDFCPLDRFCSQTNRQEITKVSCKSGPDAIFETTDCIPSMLKCSSNGRHIKGLLRQFDEDLNRLPFRNTFKCTMDRDEPVTAGSSSRQISTESCESEISYAKCHFSPFPYRTTDALICCTDNERNHFQKCGKGQKPCFDSRSCRRHYLRGGAPIYRKTMRPDPSCCRGNPYECYVIPPKICRTKKTLPGIACTTRRRQSDCQPDTYRRQCREACKNSTYHFPSVSNDNTLSNDNNCTSTTADIDDIEDDFEFDSQIVSHSKEKLDGSKTTRQNVQVCYTTYSKTKSGKKVPEVSKAHTKCNSSGYQKIKDRFCDKLITSKMKCSNRLKEFKSSRNVCLTENSCRIQQEPTRKYQVKSGNDNLGHHEHRCQTYTTVCKCCTGCVSDPPSNADHLFCKDENIKRIKNKKCMQENVPEITETCRNICEVCTENYSLRKKCKTSQRHENVHGCNVCQQKDDGTLNVCRQSALNEDNRSSHLNKKKEKCKQGTCHLSKTYKEEQIFRTTKEKDVLKQHQPHRCSAIEDCRENILSSESSGIKQQSNESSNKENPETTNSKLDETFTIQKDINNKDNINDKEREETTFLTEDKIIKISKEILDKPCRCCCQTRDTIKYSDSSVKPVSRNTSGDKYCKQKYYRDCPDKGNIQNGIPNPNVQSSEETDSNNDSDHDSSSLCHRQSICDTTHTKYHPPINRFLCCRRCSTSELNNCPDSYNRFPNRCRGQTNCCFRMQQSKAICNPYNNYQQPSIVCFPQTKPRSQNISRCSPKYCLCEKSKENSMTKQQYKCLSSAYNPTSHYCNPQNDPCSFTIKNKRSRFKNGKYSKLYCVTHQGCHDSFSKVEVCIPRCPEVSHSYFTRQGSRVFSSNAYRCTTYCKPHKDISSDSQSRLTDSSYTDAHHPDRSDGQSSLTEANSSDQGQSSLIEANSSDQGQSSLTEANSSDQRQSSQSSTDPIIIEPGLPTPRKTDPETFPIPSQPDSILVDPPHSSKRHTDPIIIEPGLPTPGKTDTETSPIPSQPDSNHGDPSHSNQSHTDPIIIDPALPTPRKTDSETSPIPSQPDSNHEDPSHSNQSHTDPIIIEPGLPTPRKTDTETSPIPSQPDSNPEDPSHSNQSHTDQSHVDPPDSSQTNSSPVEHNNPIQTNPNHIDSHLQYPSEADPGPVDPPHPSQSETGPSSSDSQDPSQSQVNQISSTTSHSLADNNELSQNDTSSNDQHQSQISHTELSQTETNHSELNHTDTDQTDTYEPHQNSSELSQPDLSPKNPCQLCSGQEDPSYEGLSQIDTTNEVPSETGYLKSHSSSLTGTEKQVDNNSTFESYQHATSNPSSRMCIPTISRSSCKIPRGPYQIPRGQCQITKGPRQIPRGPCQIPRSQCQIPRSPCQIPRDPCQIPRSPCQIPRSPCQIPRDPCQIPRSPYQIPRSPCQIPRDPCQIPRSPGQIHRDPCHCCFNPQARKQNIIASSYKTHDIKHCEKDSQKKNQIFSEKPDFPRNISCTLNSQEEKRKHQNDSTNQYQWLSTERDRHLDSFSSTEWCPKQSTYPRLPPIQNKGRYCPCRTIPPTLLNIQSVTSSQTCKSLAKNEKPANSVFGLQRESSNNKYQVDKPGTDTQSPSRYCPCRTLPPTLLNIQSVTSSQACKILAKNQKPANSVFELQHESSNNKYEVDKLRTDTQSPSRYCPCRTLPPTLLNIQSVTSSQACKILAKNQKPVNSVFELQHESSNNKYQVDKLRTDTQSPSLFSNNIKYIEINSQNPTEKSNIGNMINTSSIFSHRSSHYCSVVLAPRKNVI